MVFMIILCLSLSLSLSLSLFILCTLSVSEEKKCRVQFILHSTEKYFFSMSLGNISRVYIWYKFFISFQFHEDEDIKLLD